MPDLAALEKRLTASIADRQAEMAETVVQWANINSGSRNMAGLATMRDRLVARLTPLADRIEVVPPEPVTTLDDDGRETPLDHGDSIHATKRPEAPRRLILTGHMDTVFAADDSFQHCRMIDEARMNGPGTADMKGGLLVMIEALSALEAAGAIDDLGWDVVINADEEVASLGSAPLLRRVARQCQIGMTFEPSLTPEGTLASARRGSGNWRAHIAGRAAHAGRNPQDGRNALVAAADLALRLDRLKGEIDGLLVNVARISGGGPNNVVPDSAVIAWNMRPQDHEAQTLADSAIGQAITAVEQAHDVTLTLSGGFARPPKPFDARHRALFELVRETGADLGLTLDWQPSGGVCDGNNVAAENVVVVDTLGVRGGNIHTDCEFLIVDSLSERAALTALIIARIAQGRLEDILRVKETPHV